MLYALPRPVALLSLVVAFVVGLTVYGRAQALAARRFGDRSPQAAGRDRLDPRRHIDPLGAVAAVLSGLGWARPVPLSPRLLASPGRLATVLLAGPASTLGLALLAGAAYRSLEGPLPLLSLQTALTGSLNGPALPLFLLLSTYVLLALTLIALVPLPPLDGGRLLFALGPRTAGWRRAAYNLGERNWGAGILLALVLFGSPGILVQLLDVPAKPLLRVLR